MMKRGGKILLLVAIATLVTPIAVAENQNLVDKRNEASEYTHTVLAEYASLSYCPHCPPVSGYMDELYTSGEYDFYYVTLVVDKNNKAYQRFKELNGIGCPTVWFDGGYKKVVGDAGCTCAYIGALEDCGTREVDNIDLKVELSWKDETEFSLKVTVKNNEDFDYQGHLRAYIVEKVSRWKDRSGKNYHFAFLDYAINEDVTIEAHGVCNKSRIWDGAEHGFGDITQDNIMVIAAIFDKKDGYVDQTAASVVVENNPPNKPATPQGPTTCKAGENYTYSTYAVDPDGDKVRYCFDWGDGTRTWTDYYPSGETVSATHSWSVKGTYSIRVKAQDEYGLESEWSDPLPITVPKNGFTHAVLLEYGALSYCPHCPPASDLLYKLFLSGDYPFYYVSFVIDKNPKASKRMKNYLDWYAPTVYFDGGYCIVLGSNESTYRDAIEACASRDVHDVSIYLSTNWTDKDQLKISADVINNDNTLYAGWLRIYITEKISRWKDYSGDPFHFAFIDFATNKFIMIPPGKAYSSSMSWDASKYNLSKDNVMVIAAVAHWIPHLQKNPWNKPKPTRFLAFFVDQTVGAEP